MQGEVTVVRDKKKKPLGGGERHTNLWEADEKAARWCRHGDIGGKVGVTLPPCLMMG